MYVQQVFSALTGGAIKNVNVKLGQIWDCPPIHGNTAQICYAPLLPAPAFDRYLLLMVCSAADPLHTAAAVNRWDRKD